MSIIRIQKSSEFFIAPNKPFNSPTLSWEARGMLAYLLSKPDGWEVRTNDLVRQGPAGKDKVRRILQELEQVGYLQRYQERNPDGSFGRWCTLVYEQPAAEPPPPPTPPAPAKPETNQPQPEKPETVEPTLLITERINTESIKNEDQSITQSKDDDDFDAETAIDPHDTDHEAVVPTAVLALTEIGFTPAAAQALLTRLAAVYGSELALETAVVDWCDHASRNQRLHTPAGFVQRKLENQEQPPPRPLSQQEQIARFRAAGYQIFT